MPQTPLIKGIFVNSHIAALRKQKGDSGVEELQRRYGKPLDFKNLEDVPVREEVALLEAIVDIVTDKPLPPLERARAAGRLHFTNFSQTSYGRLLLLSLPRNPANFKILLKNSQYIARRVFTHTNFSSDEYNGTLVITMENSDYPADHFCGFFEEWMRTSGFVDPHVSAVEPKKGTFRYTLQG